MQAATRSVAARNFHRIRSWAAARHCQVRALARAMGILGGPGALRTCPAQSQCLEGHGIIARVRSPEVANLIRQTGVPFVASSLVESGQLVHGDRFGEIRTDSEAIAVMAAEHLLEQGLRQFAFCGFIGCPWSQRRENVFRETIESAGFPCYTYRVRMSNWLQSPSRMKTWEQEQPVLME